MGIYKKRNLNIEYEFLVGDSDIFGIKIANISSFSIESEMCDVIKMCDFLNELRYSNVGMVGIRLLQSNLKHINFFENEGFNFVECSYKPSAYLNEITTNSFAKGFTISAATHSDAIEISAAAQNIFNHGRYHQDCHIDNELADYRYGRWVKNAFCSKNQFVLKCNDSAGSLVAFFVVEYPRRGVCLLSLVGLMPNYIGKKIAKDVWQSLFTVLKVQGINEVLTSISSHNVAVFNLYVSLGFRFSEPEVTLHKWL